MTKQGTLEWSSLQAVRVHAGRTRAQRGCSENPLRTRNVGTRTNQLDRDDDHPMTRSTSKRSFFSIVIKLSPWLYSVLRLKPPRRAAPLTFRVVRSFREHGHR